MREIRENDSKSRIFVKGKKQMMLLTVYIHVDAEWGFPDDKTQFRRHIEIVVYT